MTEQKWEELIKRYASDDYTAVHTLELTDDLKQVIEVNLEKYHDGDINHYEGKTFEEIFKWYYIEPLIENIEYYDYLWADFPELADEMLKEDLTFVKDDVVEYIRYVSEWFKDHKEGEPACYLEWADNEGSEPPFKDYKFVNHEEAIKIIEDREPVGRYIEIDNDMYIAIDNSTKHAWTEEFKTLKEAEEYLRNHDPEY